MPRKRKMKFVVQNGHFICTLAKTLHHPYGVPAYSQWTDPKATSSKWGACKACHPLMMGDAKLANTAADAFNNLYPDEPKAFWYVLVKKNGLKQWYKV